MDAQIKLISAHMPLAQIIVINSAASLVPVVIIAACNGGLAWLVRTRRPLVHLMRGLLAGTGIFTGFLALGLLPLADFYALIFTSPLLLTALSALVLRERVGIHRWAAVVAGLCGVALIVRPDAAIPTIGALAVLANALMFAFGMVIVRRFGASESAFTFAFYTTLVTLVMAILVSVLDPGQRPVMPETVTPLLLNISAGLTGGFAALSVIAGFRIAPAPVLAPFHYSQMLWGVVIGVTAFGHWPDRMVLLGSALIAGSGLYVFHRERRLMRRNTAA